MIEFLKRLLSPRGDDLSAYRPLWHRVVELSRDPRWYADAGVADTVAGRFDAITLVLSMALIRMEGEPALVEPSVRLTELFVDDMDGQLRQSGVGDVVVGKRMGKLMSALGGRLGAFREALASGDDAAFSSAVERNVTLVDGADAGKVAAMARAFHQSLGAEDAAAILAGDITL